MEFPNKIRPILKIETTVTSTLAYGANGVAVNILKSEDRE
jgi:hypothetical protein